MAKRLKRQFITIEISKDYYDLILKRLDGKVSEIKKEKSNTNIEENNLFDFA